MQAPSYMQPLSRFGTLIKIVLKARERLFIGAWSYSRFSCFFRDVFLQISIQYPWHFRTLYGYGIVLLTQCCCCVEYVRWRRGFLQSAFIRRKSSGLSACLFKFYNLKISEIIPLSPKEILARARQQHASRLGSPIKIMMIICGVPSLVIWKRRKINYTNRRQHFQRVW